jgi:hypothetical protein
MQQRSDVFMGATRGDGSIWRCFRGSARDTREPLRANLYTGMKRAVDEPSQGLSLQSRHVCILSIQDLSRLASHPSKGDRPQFVDIRTLDRQVCHEERPTRGPSIALSCALHSCCVGIQAALRDWRGFDPKRTESGSRFRLQLTALDS